MFLTLNYHIINRAIPDKIAISEEAFEQQLAYLREHGYTTLSLAQAIADIGVPTGGGRRIDLLPKNDAEKSAGD